MHSIVARFKLRHLCLFMLVLLLGTQDASAERRTARQDRTELESGGALGPATLPAGVRLISDVPYGPHELQRMDVYLPSTPSTKSAPVIFMVHGGGWRRGDKGARGVVTNKMERWVAKGFIFISANYRLLPDTAPIAQAYDIARALGTAQAQAAAWGGDAGKFIVMGHSAGAHLVALLGASPASAIAEGVRQRWLGTIPLDSAALNVVEIMQAPHPGLYDDAFGDKPAYWLAASPYHALQPIATPMLAVCSSRRDDACPQAHAFAARADRLEVRAQVLEQDLSHGEINDQLGLPGPYTEAVEDFMGSLDLQVKRMLR
ncbi:MAG: alpha/beta hydrolase [Rhodocyclales bacterium]|nr:alpha/beta hydrolase [Rhodocyclales bacterium]